MIIAVDFDGTIVEHRYPEIGKVIPNAFQVLKKLKSEGHILILWTYRSGDELEKAIKYCKKNGLEFYAINNNSNDEEFDATYSRKIYADLYIDDRNIFGLPEWNKIYEKIKQMMEEAEKSSTSSIIEG
jgi:hydroxymethylpyrimidine pyrophosphatase-like HAD family hydrolase